MPQEMMIVAEIIWSWSLQMADQKLFEEEWGKVTQV